MKNPSLLVRRERWDRQLLQGTMKSPATLRNYNKSDLAGGKILETTGASRGFEDG